MTVVCIYHIDNCSKETHRWIFEPYHLNQSAYSFGNKNWSETVDLGYFLRHFRGPVGNRWSRAGIACSWNTKWQTWSVRRCVHARNERKSWRRCVNGWSDMANIDSLKVDVVHQSSSKHYWVIWFVYWCLLSYWSIIWHLGSSKKQRYHCLSPLVAAYYRPKTLGYVGL